MLPVSWTELLQHEPIGVVAFVFFGVIVALFTFGTGQRNEHSICFLRHSFLDPSQLEKRIEPRAQGEDRTHDLTLTKGVLYH